MIISNCNLFELVVKNEEFLDDLRCKLEKEILEFIHDEWNKNLEVYVEYTGANVEITVMQKDLDYNRFEFFIINQLCKKYNAHVNYREVVTNNINQLQYVEWGIMV